MRAISRCYSCDKKALRFVCPNCTGDTDGIGIASEALQRKLPLRPEPHAEKVLEDDALICQGAGNTEHNQNMFAAKRRPLVQGGTSAERSWHERFYLRSYEFSHEKCSEISRIF